MATYDQLVQALRNAASVGDDRSAQRIAQMIENRQYEEESSTTASALQGIGQGATFGLADELGAAARVGLDPLVGGLAAGFGVGDYTPTEGPDTFWNRMRDYQRQFTALGEQSVGEAYQQNLESQREALETARREDPWTTGIAEFAGGLATGGVGAGRAVAGQTLGAGARRLAGAGAGMGALAGYGYGEGDPIAALAFEDRDAVMRELKEAGIGAATGAAVGGALGGTLPYLGAGARGIAGLISRPFTREARLNNEANQLILNSLDEDIAAGYIDDIDDAMRQLQETPGMTAADLGPAMQRLTETLAQQPTPGGRNLRNFLTERNREQWKRIFPRLAQAVTDDGTDSFAVARRRLVAQMEENADRLYGAAYARPIRVTNRMQEIMGNPEFKQALDTANRLRAFQGKDPLPDAPRAGTMMATRELDNILQGMDDVVTATFKDAPAIARQITKPLRNEFREIMYEQNPALGRARQQWAGDTLNNEAMDKGLRILRDDADFTAEVIRDMSQSELNFFKIGALRAIARRLGSKSDTSDLTKGLFDNPRTREALRIAFGGKQKFDEFMTFIEQEQKMFNTFKEAVGNSKTAQRIIDQTTDTTGRLAGIFGFASTGSLLVAGAARRLANVVMPGRRAAERATQLANRQADVLMQEGQSGLQQALTQRQLGGLLDTGVPMSVGRGTGGLLATGIPQPGGPEYGR